MARLREDGSGGQGIRRVQGRALPLRGEVRILRLVNLPTRRGPAPEARACYEELGIDEPKPAT